ncbi:hypothetical protein QTP70_028831 [Hemibagrus guttatus]|uniref:Reverse transcriptase domain-containing protein n=1 Tax=Hemibagrus guttatus TaxID=175788 RepID=A0AAE0UQ95_9TELE|nr:hypothetical protein QTP70_028831 [Hemibagrus guttatus]
MLLTLIWGPSYPKKTPRENEVYPCALNYTVGECELLDIKLAFKEWHQCLEGTEQPFLVWRDHKNLDYLQTDKRLNKKDLRTDKWLLFKKDQRLCGCLYYLHTAEDAQGSRHSYGPPYAGHNSILLVVNRFSKMAQFINLPYLPSAKELLDRILPVPRCYHQHMFWAPPIVQWAAEPRTRDRISHLCTEEPTSWTSNLVSVEYAQHSLGSTATGLSPLSDSVWKNARATLLKSVRNYACPGMKDMRVLHEEDPPRAGAVRSANPLQGTLTHYGQFRDSTQSRSMSLDCGKKPKHLEETHQAREEHANSHTWRRQESNHQPWRDVAQRQSSGRRHSARRANRVSCRQKMQLCTRVSFLIPQHLIEKLSLLGLNTSLCNWILDFLTGRPQSVRIGNSFSSTTTLNTGVTQGCVLSPLLFTLLTHDCAAMHSSNHIVKFADDTNVVGLISKKNESAYREEVQRLTACL